MDFSFCNLKKSPTIGDSNTLQYDRSSRSYLIGKKHIAAINQWEVRIIIPTTFTDHETRTTAVDLDPMRDWIHASHAKKSVPARADGLRLQEL